MTYVKKDHRQGSNPLRIAIWSSAAFVLLLPLIAMQFTTEVNWDTTDFVVFGIMLLMLCGTYEFATRLTANKAYRLGVASAILGMFLLTWMNLAVGIIGNEENPANLMFLALPLVGLIGALKVRFESRGMSHTMVAVAITQTAIALVTFMADWGQIFILTGFFVLIWLISAQLFRKVIPQVSTESLK